MSERIIELKWKCNSCGISGILGRFKECPNCGSPREEGEMQMEGLDTDADGDGYNDAKSVVDPELVKLANSGYDWFCANCKAGNIGTGRECSSCGASRFDEHKPDPPRQRARLSPEQDFSQDYEEPYTAPKENHSVMIGVATAVAVVFALFMYAFYGPTHDVEGRVTEVEYTNSVRIEKWVSFREREWRHRAVEKTEVKPIEGRATAGYSLVPGTCHSEFYENDKVPCGTEEEAYDCSTYHTETKTYTDTCYDTKSVPCGETCRSQGNGFAKCRTKYCDKKVARSCTKTKSERIRDFKTCYRTVTKFCKVPVYKDKCEYESQKWQLDRNPVITASDKLLSWPSYSIAADERDFKTSKYKVVFSYTDDKKRGNFQRDVTQAEYLSWDVGQKAYIRLNYAGTVVDYSKKPLPEN